MIVGNTFEDVLKRIKSYKEAEPLNYSSRGMITVGCHCGNCNCDCTHYDCKDCDCMVCGD